VKAWTTERLPAHLGGLSCRPCGSQFLLAFEFGERRPQRFVSQLLGLARL
jgi:hypothetical protein